MLLKTRQKSTYSIRTELFLGFIAATMFTFATGWRAWEETPIYFVGSWLCVVAFILAGLTVRHEPDRKRLGAGLLACGFFWSARLINAWNVGPFPMIGIIADACFYIAATWTIFSDPDNRERLRRENFVLLLIGTLLIDHVVVASFGQPEWSGYNSSVWWPSFFATTESSYELAHNIDYIYQSGLAAAFAIAVWLKLRETSGIDHAVSSPIAIGFCIAGIMGAISAPGETIPNKGISTGYFIMSVAFFSVPFGALIASLRRRLRHADVARQIHQFLGHGVATIDTVQNALRSALDDQSLVVAYWNPKQKIYADAINHVIDLDRPADGWTVRYVRTTTGDPLAAIIVSRLLDRHAAIVDTAVTASAIALENARLNAVINSQLDEVRQSRTRIAEAGLAERRRIERDLHDGVQQRLLALGVRVGAAKQLAQDDAVKQSLDHVTYELQSSIEMLRDLARGIHPPELRQFGIRAAIASVVERFAIPITTDVIDRRFEPAIESTIYFIVCEALTNVAKHAFATRATVMVTCDHSCLVVVVADNGVGGANQSGNGLTGLVDRVESVSGQLSIMSGLNGTEIRATIPEIDK